MLGVGNLKINKSSNKVLKYQFISILTAVALWLYVMTIIDPEERKTIRDIPISITNLSEISDEDMVIYPKSDLKSDIVVRGKLSDVQKLNNENVHIMASIDNPVEGKNQLDLSSNLSSRVSHDFKNEFVVVNLEKIVRDYYKVDVIIPDKDRDLVHSATPDIKNVLVSGPRSQMAKIAKVGVYLTVDKKGEDFVKSLDLNAYDKNNKIISDLKFKDPTVDVHVNMVAEKKVSVKIPLGNGRFLDSSYKISPNEIIITGDAKDLTNIDAIMTEEVDDTQLRVNTPKRLNLSFPNGILSKDKILTVDVVKTQQ